MKEPFKSLRDRDRELSERLKIKLKLFLVNTRVFVLERDKTLFNFWAIVREVLDLELKSQGTIFKVFNFGEALSR
jgi:hypothetical protein